MEDARRLSRLLRMGEFKEVYMPSKAHCELRELVRGCTKTVRDMTRHKNRIMALFHTHGVKTPRTAVYSEAGLFAFSLKVKREVPRLIVAVEYDCLYATTEAHEKLSLRLQKMLCKTREYKLLQTIPGIGPVVASIMIAIIVAPSRFSNRRKLWAYAGLGKKCKWSGDKKKAKEGGSNTGNRLLKYAVMLAAKTAIHGDNHFSRQYAAMLEKKINPGMARKNVARNILTTACAIWGRREAYMDDYQV